MRFLPRLVVTALAGTAVAGACSSTKTTGQLMVSIQTDLSIPKDIDRIRVDVFAFDDRLVESGEYPIGRGELLIPASIGIVGGDAVPIARVRVIAIAGTEGRVFREIVTSVPENRVALLRMPLQWLCNESAEAVPGSEDPLTGIPAFRNACPTGQTCNAGRCMVNEVDSSNLPDYSDALVYGGGDANGVGGNCFDTEGCFDDGSDAQVDLQNCQIANPGGGPVNVAVIPADGSGMCGRDGCYITIDRNEEFGWFFTGDGAVNPGPIGGEGGNGGSEPIGRGGASIDTGGMGGGSEVPVPPGDCDPAACDVPPDTVPCCVTPDGPCGIDVDGRCTETFFRQAPPQRTQQEGDGAIIQLPVALCDRLRDGRIERVRVTTACETKGADVPPCGDWTPVGGGGQKDSGGPVLDGGNEDTGVDAFCGDGNQDPGEDCDDNNNEPGDGCDENCQFEGEVLNCGGTVCGDRPVGPNLVQACCPESDPNQCGLDMTSVGGRSCVQITLGGTDDPACEDAAAGVVGSALVTPIGCCTDVGLCGVRIQENPELGCIIDGSGTGVPCGVSNDAGGTDAGSDGSVMLGSDQDLGQPCFSDGDCTGGLFCMGEEDGDLPNGEGPANGVCTIECTGDPSICQNIGPGVTHPNICLDFQAGRSFCLQGCGFGPTGTSVFDSNKCRGRPDMACSPTTMTGVNFCKPQCASDDDCPRGQCNPETGFCNGAGLPPGDPQGAPCTTSPDSCQGVCISLPLGTAAIVEYCSRPCVAASETLGFGCGHSGGPPFPAACLLSPNEVSAGGGPGPGDTGLCVSLCDCDDDCGQVDLVCQDQGSPILGRAGVCTPRLDPSDQVVTGIPCGT